jgi:protein required for attachment to host cells
VNKPVKKKTPAPKTGDQLYDLSAELLEKANNLDKIPVTSAGEVENPNSHKSVSKSSRSSSSINSDPNIEKRIQMAKKKLEVLKKEGKEK